jgi:hypothetical protein
MLLFPDDTTESTTTTGTGPIALLGATTGNRRFGTTMVTGDTCHYHISGGTEWETGVGTYDSVADAIARTTVLSSSNGNAIVSFSAGVKTIFATVAGVYFQQSMIGPGVAIQVSRANFSF